MPNFDLERGKKTFINFFILLFGDAFELGAEVVVYELSQIAIEPQFILILRG